MKEEQFTQLINSLNKKDEKSYRVEMFDSLQKIGVALCVASILYVASQMGNINTSIAVMQQQITAFSKFTEAPRFTADNNSAADQKVLGTVKDISSGISVEIRDIRNSVNGNTIELNRRNDFMDDVISFRKDTSKRLNKLEAKVDIE